MRLSEYIEKRGIQITKMAAKCNLTYGQLYRIIQKKSTRLENAVRIEIFTDGLVKAIELVPEEKIKQIKREVTEGY